MRLRKRFSIVPSPNKLSHHLQQRLCTNSTIWARIHIDFAGPLDNRMYLIMVDANSKWIEAFPMTSTTATYQDNSDIENNICSLWDPRIQIMVPSLFHLNSSSSAKQNGIRHILVAAYHPKSNGLAQRAVKIVKDGLEKMSDGTVEDQIARFLFAYRITPQSTTQMSPANGKKT